MHTPCAREASTLVSWKHLWFSNPGMRRLIEERGLFGLDIAFCQQCRDDLLEQILANYRALQRFDEGARFLDISSPETGHRSPGVVTVQIRRQASAPRPSPTGPRARPAVSSPNDPSRMADPRAFPLALLGGR